MKYMVISDIHGSVDNLSRILEIYREENCEKLLILGDLFNYGIDFNRDDIVEILNQFKDSIIAVRGNCDYNINNLNFDIPYINKANINSKKIIITHGHLYTTDYLSNQDADIIFFGHSHIPSFEKINNKLFINPGSISKSRRGENSFIIVDLDKIVLKNLDNKKIKEYL